MTKKTKRRKHVPQRTCVGCREVLPKRSLIRIVRSQQGVQVDLTGKLSGRGAYLHNRYSCWENSLKGDLSHALRTDLTDEDIASLSAYAENLRQDDSSSDGGTSKGGQVFGK